MKLIRTKSSAVHDAAVARSEYSTSQTDPSSSVTIPATELDAAHVLPHGTRHPVARTQAGDGLRRRRLSRERRGTEQQGKREPERARHTTSSTKGLLTIRAAEVVR